MPRTEMILRVFIASPNDVHEERELLEDIIKELNDSWSEHLRIRFDPIKWETHSYPGVGTDAQDVINREIGDDYQVFIGILGKKFGTPTLRAESGTAEEFDKAYKRHEQDPDSLDIMVYFNRAPPISLDDFDLNQYGLVEKFREKLGEEGVYYWKYNNKEEFVAFVRNHLAKVMLKWKKKNGFEGPITIKVPSKQEEKRPGEEVEHGLIDLIELGEENFNDVNEVVQRMGEAITAIGQKMTERAREIDNIKTSEGKPDIRNTKKVIDNAAKDMESFAVRMEVEIPLFSNSYYSGIDAYSRAISIYANELNKDDEELSAILDNAQYLRENIEKAMDSVINFRNIVDRLPRITTSFNRAKKHVVSVLDNLLRELTAARNLAHNIEMTVGKTAKES